MRAVHLLDDGEPKIFSDNLALGLSGARSEAEFRGNLEKIRTLVASDIGPERADRLFRNIRATMVMRSRYTEDALETAVRGGTRQYVILGAGLDSFAYRRPDLEGAVRVFEVDLPASQAWKRQRLAALNIAEPSNVVYVPLDLEHKTLRESLRAAGLGTDEPCFISWLGTTQYLTRDANFATLREVVALPSGSEIVFQYQVPARLLDDENLMVFEALTAAASRGGEPWLTVFDPDELAQQVRAIGFSEISDFGPHDAHERYFAGRADGLSASYLSHLMHARAGRLAAP